MNIFELYLDKIKSNENNEVKKINIHSKKIFIEKEKFKTKIEKIKSYIKKSIASKVVLSNILSYKINGELSYNKLLLTQYCFIEIFEV